MREQGTIIDRFKDRLKGTILGAVKAPPEELKDDGAIASVANRVVDPESTTEFVLIGGRRVAIVFLMWKTERRMLEIIAPYLKTLTDSAMIGAFDEMLASLLVEAHYDLTRLACLILEPQFKDLEEFKPQPAIANDAGEVVVPARSTLRVIEDWLDDNARFEEIADLVLRQTKMNKMADSLGKLWAPAALSARVLRVLNTLPRHLTQALQSNSTDSPPDMESTTST